MSSAAAVTAPSRVVARTPAQLVWRRFRRDRRALVCLPILLGVVLAVFAIPLADATRHQRQDTSRRYRPPSGEGPMGTDHLGRDVFWRTLRGGQVSILVGFVAALVSLTIGVLYGSASALAGGKTDLVMMRIVDILYGLPFMFVVIIVMAILKTRSILVVFAVLGAFQWLTIARIVRGQVLSLKEKEFVESARALGAARLAILVRHLLPNTVGPVLVYTTLTVPSLMLQEAFLSFLGLGVSEPNTSWGQLISEGRQVIQADFATTPWWILIFPGACLALTLFCLNAIGDGLRDAFDVEARG